MSFQEPGYWIVAGLAAALGAAGLAVAESRRRRDLLAFASAPMLAALGAGVSPGRRRFRGSLLVAAIVMGCIALARPTFGFRFEETKRSGTDVVFAVDVSRSMLAPDLRPNRLERAKLAVADLVATLDGDRVGLVAFAGSAFVQSPLTSDHRAFAEALGALEPSIIPRGGTDVGAALHEAENAFRTAPSSQKIVVLLSDGEDLEGNARVAAAEVAKRGVALYTVGVGTVAGETIPLDRRGVAAVVLDEAGRPVTSKLDEDGLQDVAEATGGFYVALGGRGEGLARIRDEVLAKAPEREHSARTQRTPTERFQWPLGLALAAAVAEALLGERGRRSRARATLRAAPAALAAVSWALLAPSLAMASPHEADEAFRSGNHAVAARAWREAAERDPDDARLHLNEGVAAYRANDPEAAEAAFSRAIDHGEVPLQQRAYYNLGNARVRSAEAAGSTDPALAKGKLERALEAYDGALALDPDDGDARYNRELVAKRLDAMKQPQAQQPEQQPQAQQEQAQQEQEQEQKQQPGGEQKQEQGGQEPERSPQQQSQAQGPRQGEGQPQAGPQSGDPQQQSRRPQDQGKPEEQSETRAPTEPTEQNEAREQAAPQGPTSAKDEAGRPASRDPSEADDTWKRHGGAAPERADGREEPENGDPSQTATAEHEMTAADAAALLDSLRGEDARSPRRASARAGVGSTDDEPIRNW